ncbi:MAG TPA: O-antigen ligase family protein, partial [Dehalococcoidia bacterium]|nr:O-antigen ligase family protein [Dehalococcoidia bacterium]
AWLVLVLVILASALAVSTKRVGWIAVAAGLAVALSRIRPPRKRVFVIVGAVTASLVAWTIVDQLLAPSTSLSGARRFGELGAGSANARIGAWKVLGRSWAERSALGWGPGNTWSAYVSAGTPSHLGVERGYGDSHNILVEMAVTTGAIGLAAFLLLASVATRQMWRGTRTLGWAFGAAAALFVHHLMQPMHVVLTPLMFLMAGLACRPAAPVAERLPAGAVVPPNRPYARTLIGISLVAGVVATSGSLVSSALERFGRTYASEPALRAALAVSPGRITAAEALATSLALDARSGDPAAGREAAELMGRTVGMHPWNPGVRLVAADVHTLMQDPAGAAEWTQRHFARFPGDLPSLGSRGSQTGGAARP